MIFLRINGTIWSLVFKCVCIETFYTLPRGERRMNDDRSENFPKSFAHPISVVIFNGRPHPINVTGAVVLGDPDTTA